MTRRVILCFCFCSNPRPVQSYLCGEGHTLHLHFVQIPNQLNSYLWGNRVGIIHHIHFCLNPITSINNDIETSLWHLILLCLHLRFCLNPKASQLLFMGVPTWRQPKQCVSTSLSKDNDKYTQRCQWLKYNCIRTADTESPVPKM